MSPLSDLLGPWHWEQRGDQWWRINERMKIESGPHEHPWCTGCHEPIELSDPSDPESWCHAEDANYWGDHTAWV